MPYLGNQMILTIQLLAFTRVQFKLTDDLRSENLTSIFLNQNLYVAMNKEPTQFTNYTVRDGLLMYQGKILLDPMYPLVCQILEECHSTLNGGHGGIQKTTAKVSVAFTWPGVKQAVKKYVCQQMKSETKKLAGLLQPLPIPDQIWQDVSMDFITALLNSQGYTTILVVVNRYSKQAHFGPLPSSYSASCVADLFALQTSWHSSVHHILS